MQKIEDLKASLSEVRGLAVEIRAGLGKVRDRIKRAGVQEAGAEKIFNDNILRDEKISSWFRRYPQRGKKL
jgi:hypothetical protein